MKRFSALPRSRSRDQTRADPPNREAGKKSLSAHFKVAPLVGAALLALAMRPASAEVFTIGGTFTDVGGNSPGSFSQAVTFAPGTTSLDGGALSLNISIVPVGDAAQDEWVVFDYQTTTGNPLSQPSQNWSLSQNGLPAAVPGKFVGDFTQFLELDGNPIQPNEQHFRPNPDVQPGPRRNRERRRHPGLQRPVPSRAGIRPWSLFRPVQHRHQCPGQHTGLRVCSGVGVRPPDSDPAIGSRTGQPRHPRQRGARVWRDPPRREKA